MARRWSRFWPIRSVGLPITLGTIMIVLVIALIVGWILLSVPLIVSKPQGAGLYWTLLWVGTGFLVFLLVGVVLYLWLSIQAIGLNQQQSNFIDSVTHELKSPIASLKLYLQTLNRREVSEQQRADFYKFMLDDIERLDRLINHLLVAAKIDQGPAGDDFEVVELGHLLKSCADSVAAQYHQSPTVVEFNVQPAIVRGRAVDLEMIFRNLIDNAIKYAGSPPKVWIASYPNGRGQVVTKISDNGRGVAPAWRRKIFGRFFRLGSELERDRPGIGLGLYLVWMQVRQLRGKITVRNRDAGPGAEFEVRLAGDPVILEPQASSPPPAAASAPPPAPAETSS